MSGAPEQAWATKTGLFSTPKGKNIFPHQVADWISISQVFSRYAMAHDEVDLEQFGDVFAPDAVLEVSLSGPVFDRHVGRESIVKNLAFVAGTQKDQRRHAVTNLVIDFEHSDRAHARAYGIVSAADAADVRISVSCAYTATLERQPDGQWCFSYLWIGLDFYAGQAPNLSVEE